MIISQIILSLENNAHLIKFVQ